MNDVGGAHGAAPHGPSAGADGGVTGAGDEGDGAVVDAGGAGTTGAGDDDAEGTGAAGAGIDGAGADGAEADGAAADGAGALDVAGAGEFETIVGAAGAFKPCVSSVVSAVVVVALFSVVCCATLERVESGAVGSSEQAETTAIDKPRTIVRVRVMCASPRANNVSDSRRVNRLVRRRARSFH